MKLKLYSLILLGIGSLAVSCKSATKLYEKGRYDEAVELAAKKLQKDPDDQKLLDVLQNAYRFAVDDHESRIRSNSDSKNELKWEWIYNEYADLQRLYQSIYNTPSVFNAVRPTDYSSFLVTYREKAGEVRYDRGVSLMSNNDKMSYRNAYREFQAALGFVPGDIDIKQKMNEAYNYAVINVVVLPVEERSAYQFSSYNERYRNFDDNVIRYLQNGNGNEFIRYYTAQDAASRNIRPDQFVDVRFSRMNVGRSYDDNKVRNVTKDVVIKETVYRPDSIVKEYAKVNARITTTTRTMRSEGFVQVVVRDENNRQVWSNTYSGQHFWTTDFASYTGDARALTEADKQIINRAQQYPPREDDIIRSIVDEIQSKAECGIRDYFNRY